MSGLLRARPETPEGLPAKSLPAHYPSMAESKADLQGIKSIEVGFRLLSALTAARSSLPLCDLARSSGMSPSKAHRYLASFMKTGLVEQDPATRDYRLGPFAFDMGLAAFGSSDHLRHAIDVQIKLRDELDETVVLTVWGSHGPTVLRVEENSDPVIMTMKVGATLPLMQSAAGRIFAAFMPRRIIESYLQVANFSASVYSRRDIVRYDDIEPELEEIRRTRLSVSHGEVLRGVNAVAGPLLAPHGQLVGALGVIGQQESLDMSSDGHIARVLHRAVVAYERSAAISTANRPRSLAAPHSDDARHRARPTRER
jgi:DNA-binding IclR family transcriptional regulator